MSVVTTTCAPLRLMAVHAHPDDESSKGAATLAKYAAAGVDVMVVTCTGGERGDVLNPALANDPAVLADLPGLRQREMAQAVAALGVRHRWLGFVDSGLPQGDPLPPLPAGSFATQNVATPATALARVIREFQPHVVVTYDETGGYPHPDHIMCHRVSMAGIEAAAQDRMDLGGDPWQVLKVYYVHGFSLTRMMAIHQAMIAAGLVSPFSDWIDDRSQNGYRDPDVRVTTRVPAADYFDARDQALRAHATQIDPNGFFFAVPREIESAVWPTEDFELASSKVPTSAREDDLFAGIRETVSACSSH